MNDIQNQASRGDVARRKKKKNRTQPPSTVHISTTAIEKQEAATDQPGGHMTAVESPLAVLADAASPTIPMAEATVPTVSATAAVETPLTDRLITAPDPAADEPVVDPTLVAYFGKEPIKILSFVKAVRASKRRRFDHADMAAADEMIVRNDRDGSRVWLLATNASMAPAIEGWIWPHIRNRLVHIVGRDLDLFAVSPTEVLKMLVVASVADIDSDDRLLQKKAETNLRLGTAWLMEQRNLETIAAAEILKGLFLEKPKDAEKRIRRAISRGTRAEMQTAVTALTLADERIRSALVERDNERRQRQDLRDRLDAAEEKLRLQADVVRGLNAKNAELEGKLDEVRRQAENADRHAGHDMSQLKADMGVSLLRVKKLLEDAASAVSICMKRADEGSLRGLQAAEMRLQAVRNAIEEVGQ